MNANWAAAQAPPPTANANPVAALSPSTAAFQKLLTALVLEHLPLTYEDTRNWGQTARRWNGLSLQLDDFDLKTHRKFKEVNHGTWTAYRLELVEPEKNFEFQAVNLRPLDDGRLGCDLAVETPLACFGRLSKWSKGVQLISLSAEASARVRLKVSCAMTTRLDAKHFPPDLVLAPQATSASLELLEFRVHKVSKVGGEVAEQLGRGMRHTVEKKLESQQEKLVEKINQQLAKHANRLRFSLHDLAASQWSAWAKTLTGGNANTSAAASAQPTLNRGP